MFLYNMSHYYTSRKNCILNEYLYHLKLILLTKFYTSHVVQDCTAINRTTHTGKTTDFDRILLTLLAPSGPPTWSGVKAIVADFHS